VSLEYHFADLRSPRVLAVDGPGAEDGQDVVPRAVCTLLRGVDIVYWGAGREPKPSGVVWRAMECPRQKVGRNDGVGSYKIEMSSNALGTVSANVRVPSRVKFQSPHLP